MTGSNFWPGRFAPAFLLAALALALPGAAMAQTAPQAAQPPISVEPVPSELELAKLLWSTMTAVHHANLSGNYSVLRDISSPGFQVMNNAARLGEIFASIRESRSTFPMRCCWPPPIPSRLRWWSPASSGCAAISASGRPRSSSTSSSNGSRGAGGCTACRSARRRSHRKRRPSAGARPLDSVVCSVPDFARDKRPAALCRKSSRVPERSRGTLRDSTSP